MISLQLKMKPKLGPFASAFQILTLPLAYDDE
jgi:hypothetical protein